MELLIAFAGLFVLVAVAGTFVRAAGDPSDFLTGLFRTSHDLGWPVGVQEEDLPPRVPVDDAETAADVREADVPNAAAWREPVKPKLRRGLARR